MIVLILTSLVVIAVNGSSSAHGPDERQRYHGEQVSGELTGQKIVGGTCHLDSLGLQRSCAGSLISSIQIFGGNGSLTRRPSER